MLHRHILNLEKLVLNQVMHFHFTLPLMSTAPNPFFFKFLKIKLNYKLWVVGLQRTVGLGSLWSLEQWVGSSQDTLTKSLSVGFFFFVFFLFCFVFFCFFCFFFFCHFDIFYNQE